MRIGFIKDPPCHLRSGSTHPAAFPAAEVHTTGMDIQHKLDAVAALTLGKDMWGALGWAEVAH